MSKVILVGGSKDGTVLDNETGLSAMHNIVLNDDYSGPQYVDRYVPTGVQDRDGNDVFAHVGRYNGEESESYWEKLDKQKVEELRAAARKEREEAAATAEAERKLQEEADADAALAAADAAKKEKEKANEVVETPVVDPDTGEVTETSTEAPAEVTQDAETGEVKETSEEA
jgi:hypothetical protein